jgi:hypothetical protein
MISTDSLDGIQILLNNLYMNSDSLMNSMPPTDSALSQFRNTISFEFFKNIFYNTVESLRCYLPKYKGFRFFGIDGDQYYLPRTEDILRKGYKGYPISDKKETYSAVMYAVIATELMTGASVDFHCSPTNNEIAGALKMISRSRKKDVFVYDRLYYSKELVKAHIEQESYFIIRLKRSGIPKEFKDFIESDKKEEIVYVDNCKLRIVKTGYDSNSESIFLLTNLPKSIFSRELLGLIYNRRWRSETSNRETTSTLALDHFHGRDSNKIMQEIYACLWLKLSSAILTASEFSYDTFFDKKKYQIPNIKESLRAFESKLLDLLSNIKIEEFIKKFMVIITRSIEVREHNSRSYEKETSCNRNKGHPVKTAERSG